MCVFVFVCMCVCVCVCVLCVEERGKEPRKGGIEVIEQNFVNASIFLSTGIFIDWQTCPKKKGVMFPRRVIGFVSLVRNMQVSYEGI